MEEFALKLGRGLIGVVVILGLAFLLSRDRRNINLRIVGTGILFVFGMAILMLKVPFAQAVVEGISHFFIRLVDFSDAGARFIFGDLVDTSSYGFIFAFHVIPNIIFFSAISSLLYYFNILPWIVRCFAWLLARAYKLSGAECTAAAANVFLGQVTAPLMIKPFLPRLSKSELFCVMTGGMATISGTVMLGLIAIMGGDDPVQRLVFAKNLLTASILSAPSALLIAHIIMPKSGPVDSRIEISRADVGSNMFDSIVKGTEDGLKVGLMVGSSLIVFTALIALLNWGFKDGLGGLLGINGWIGEVSGGIYDGLTLQSILGTLFAPIAWVLGIEGGDILFVGQVLGERTVLNEFMGYIAFSNGIEEGVITNVRSIMIGSFALCSFANFNSIGVQIAGLSAMASNQRYTVSRYAFLSMLAGNLACFMSATVAGVFL